MFNVKIKSKQHPSLADMINILSSSADLPVKINQIKTIEIKVGLVNEWINKLSLLFKKIDFSGSNYGILEVIKTLLFSLLFKKSRDLKLKKKKILTPRIDLNSIVNKLQNQLQHQSSSSSNTTSLSSATGVATQGASSLTSGNNSSIVVSPTSTETTKISKRMRVKSLNNTAQNLNLNSQIDQQIAASINNIESVYDFYNENKYIPFLVLKKYLI